MRRQPKGLHQPQPRATPSDHAAHTPFALKGQTSFRQLEASQPEDAVEAGEDAIAAKDFQQMIEAWTDRTACGGHAHGMHEQS